MQLLVTVNGPGWEEGTLLCSRPENREVDDVAPRSTAREDMVLSAIALFRENGIEATKLTDVTTHAGAARGSIYHYFPGGKQQLVEEATRLAGGAMTSLLEAGLPERGPAATLAAVVDGFRTQLIASGFASGCPVAAASLDGTNWPAGRDVAGESFTAWEDAVAESLAQHGVARDRANSLATTAVAMLEGALLLAKAQRDLRALDRVESELGLLLDSVLGET